VIFYGLFWIERLNLHRCFAFVFPKNLFFLPRLPGCITSVSHICLCLPSSSFCRNFSQTIQQCFSTCFSSRTASLCLLLQQVCIFLLCPWLGKFHFFSFPSLVFTLMCCVAHSSVHLFLVVYHAYYKKLVRFLPAVLIPSQRHSYAIFWCRIYSSPDYTHQRSFLTASKLSARSPNSCAFCASFTK